MFTGKPQKNRSAATSYFDEHLSHNDDDTQNVSLGQPAGHWIGVGAQMLGLEEGEVVTREAFLRLWNRSGNSDTSPSNRLRSVKMSND